MPPPFFIVGVPRSGTTLLSLLLDNHTDVYVSDHSMGAAFAGIEERVLQAYGLQGDARVLTPDKALRAAIERDERLAALCEQVRDAAMLSPRELLYQACEAAARQHGKAVWGDKSPRLVSYMPAISFLLPEARFIHVIRDGRAVALSMRDRQYWHLYRNIHLWKRMVYLGQVHGQVIGPSRYLEVSYESLLRQPETTLSSVCGFLGVSYQAEMTDLSRKAETRTDDAYVAPTLDSRRIDAWQQRLTARQVRRMEKIAGDLLLAQGYALQQYPATRLFAALSPLQVGWFDQWDACTDLFRGRKGVMKDRQWVMVSVPLRQRLRRFVRTTMRNLWNERVIEHFRSDRRMME